MKKFIVYVEENGVKYFYGAFDDLQWAKEFAAMVGGKVA